MGSKAFNQDCMTGMREFPDKWKALTQGGTWAAKYKTGDASWDIKPEAEYFAELFRVSKNQIVWGGNYFTDFLPVSRCWICWDKIAHMETMADHEMAWCSFDKNSKIFKCLRSGNQTGETRIHITQKPTRLYSWIYHNYLPQGGKVLDTHLGSGSNRIAADKAGNIDFTAYELDPDYFAAQEKRWKNYKSQLVLELT